MKKSKQIKKESNDQKITEFFRKTPQREEDGEKAGSSHQTQELTIGDLKTSQSSKPAAANNDVPGLTHSHTFTFCFNGEEPTEITCRKKGTIQESLETSREFKEQITQKKINTKVIIIKRDVVSSKKAPNLGYVVGHFPCSLIQGEKLTIYAIDNFMDKAGSPVATQDDRDLITFTIENICHPSSKLKTLLKPDLKLFNPVCVYGYKNETVLSALQRDGRFEKYIFERICKLKTKEAFKELDENCLCQDVSGRHFQCYISTAFKEGSKRQKAQGKCNRKGILIKKTKESKCKTRSTPLAQPPCVETSNSKKSDFTQNPKQSWYEIPDSEEILKLLREQFGELLEHLRQRESGEKPDLELVKEEYFKHSEGFSVLAMENLLNVAPSVCKVQTNGGSGTGFLLFSDYILTNAHVIKRVYNETQQVLQSEVSVCFDFKNPHHDQTKYYVKKEVLAYGYGNDDFNRHIDFAVLQFMQKPAELQPLICQYTSPRSNKNSICMIGHPAGEVKKIDISVMIIHEERQEALQGELCITWSPVSQCYQIPRGADILTYDTCFGSGSSGSPIFDSECRLIAVHTGTFKGERGCIMEYAIPMKSILENIIMILAKKNLVDPLVSLMTEGNEHVKLLYDSFVDLVKKKQNPSLLNFIKNVDEQIRDRESHPMDIDEVLTDHCSH